MPSYLLSCSRAVWPLTSEGCSLERVRFWAMEDLDYGADINKPLSILEMKPPLRMFSTLCFLVSDEVNRELLMSFGILELLCFTRVLDMSY